MKRVYKCEGSDQKNRDGKVASACIMISIAVAMMSYLYCSNIKSETDVLLKDASSDISLSSDNAGSVSTVKNTVSTAVSMKTAGKAVADLQNQMITENDKYLVTVKNAAISGYKDRILMTDTYKNLLDTFNEGYMKENPAGTTGVMWSECGVWEFDDTYDYSKELHASMSAVWICYATSDTTKTHPYAFLTATYVTATDSFMDPVLSKTQWYPTTSYISENAAAAGMKNDITVSADQCDDPEAMNGGNDASAMTSDQLKIREDLQKQLDANIAKESAVTISD